MKIDISTNESNAKYDDVRRSSKHPLQSNKSRYHSFLHLRPPIINLTSSNSSSFKLNPQLNTVDSNKSLDHILQPTSKNSNSFFHARKKLNLLQDTKLTEILHNIESKKYLI